MLPLTASIANAQASATDLVVMPVGDSITAGYKSTTGNGFRGPLWTSLNGQVASVDFVGTQSDGSMLDPKNEGHYGWRIDQIAGIITGSLNTYKPNVVLMLIGINDLNTGYEVSTAPDRWASLLDQIIAAEPDATILASKLFINSNATTESRVVTFNAALPAIVQARANAGKHVLLVDQSSLALADLADGLHPNDAGYVKVAANFDSAIESAISKGWVTAPLPSSTIYSGISGYSLDTAATNGAKAEINDYAKSTAKWTYDGTKLETNGYCLDVYRKGTTNGSLVQVWTCNGGTNQEWKSENGELVNPASGLCLDDPASNKTDGTQLQLWSCNGGKNQKWSLPVE
jgi:lysophospholipase L1-like esterase